MPTVNEDFKRELKQLFTKGLKEALSSDWVVTERADDGGIDSQEFFMLTISSQMFRIVVVLHFTKSGPLENYILGKVGSAGNKTLEDDKFYDFLGEVGNAFCGAIKRELGKTVTTLGMSTPNRLGYDCLKFLGAAHDMEAHANAALDGSKLMYASLFLYADEDLDFKVAHSPAPEEEVGSGELEFF